MILKTVAWNMLGLGLGLHSNFIFDYYHLRNTILNAKKKINKYSYTRVYVNLATKIWY